MSPLRAKLSETLRRWRELRQSPVLTNEDPDEFLDFLVKELECSFEADPTFGLVGGSRHDAASARYLPNTQSHTLHVSKQQDLAAPFSSGTLEWKGDP